MNPDGTAPTLDDSLRWSTRNIVREVNDLTTRIRSLEGELERLHAQRDSYARLLGEYEALGIDRGIWADRAAMIADIGLSATDPASRS